MEPLACSIERKPRYIIDGLEKGSGTYGTVVKGYKEGHKNIKLAFKTLTLNFNLNFTASFPITSG